MCRVRSRSLFFHGEFVMNRRAAFLSAFAAVLMLTLVASAQDRPRQGRPGGRMGMGSAMLLRAEAVQKELNLTEEQVTKLEESLAPPRNQGGQRRSFQDMTAEEREKAMEEFAARTAEQEKKIAEVLDEKQVARLKQIRLQASGVMAIVGDELAKELSITEEQTGKIRAAMRELRESMRDAGPAAFGEMGEKMNAKVMEILTEDQKAKYKEMLGEPFDLSQLRRRAPGAQRRGGGN